MVNPPRDVVSSLNVSRQVVGCYPSRAKSGEHIVHESLQARHTVIGSKATHQGMEGELRVRTDRGHQVDALGRRDDTKAGISAQLGDVGDLGIRRRPDAALLAHRAVILRVVQKVWPNDRPVPIGVVATRRGTAGPWVEDGVARRRPSRVRSAPNTSNSCAVAGR